MYKGATVERSASGTMEGRRKSEFGILDYNSA